MSCPLQTGKTKRNYDKSRQIPHRSTVAQIQRSSQINSVMEKNLAKHNTIIEDYISAYNAFDIERMLSSVHREVVFKNVSGGEVNAEAIGIEELRKMAEQSQQLFSSRQQSIISLDEQGDIITVRIKFEAILAVDLPNAGKAGDPVDLVGTSIFEFKNGLLWRITDYS